MANNAKDPPELISDSDDDIDEVPVRPKKLFGFVVPEGALRVRVIDAKGGQRWRKLEEVRGDDAPDLMPDGQPLFQNKPIGRPPKVELHDVLKPTTELVKDLVKVKIAQMRTDTIVATTETSPESSDVLNQVMSGLAEEAAALRFERMEAERNGQDSSQLSVRRVHALKAIGDAWIKRKEQIQNKSVDLESRTFEKLLGFISETFALALEEAGVELEMSNSVFDLFGKKLEDEGWKNEAKSRMKE